jgi:hypothetical protein
MPGLSVSEGLWGDWIQCILAETLRQRGNGEVTNEQWYQIGIFEDDQHLGDSPLGVGNVAAGSTIWLLLLSEL